MLIYSRHKRLKLGHRQQIPTEMARLPGSEWITTPQRRRQQRRERKQKQKRAVLHVRLKANPFKHKCPIAWKQSSSCNQMFALTPLKPLVPVCHDPVWPQSFLRRETFRWEMCSWSLTFSCYSWLFSCSFLYFCHHFFSFFCHRVLSG